MLYYYYMFNDIFFQWPQKVQAGSGSGDASASGRIHN